MKWKHSTVQELSGTSFKSETRVMCRAINHNAETLAEAVQKIEELSQIIEELKTKLESEE